MSSKHPQKEIFAMLLLFFSLLAGINSFKLGDPVPIMVNKVSPYNNPTETYRYYDLPFCKPEEVEKGSQTFGEKLTGNRKRSSLYKAEFGVNSKKVKACEIEPTEEQLTKFREAIKQDYVFDMYIDDFVVGNFIGYTKNDRIYLATHFNFNLFYNKEKGTIIKALVDFDENSHVVDITNPDYRHVLFFTYSFNWADTTFTARTSNNGNDTPFSTETHWITFFDGITINIFLLAILGIIFQKIQKQSDNTLANNEIDIEKKDPDLNWKAIRGEVFRSPSNKSLLGAALGTGSQLGITVIVVLIFGTLGMYNRTKGSLITAGIYTYMVSAVVSGMTSGRLFRYCGGKTWVANLLVTVFFFPLPASIIATILNNIAWIDNSTSALPFSAVLLLVVMLIICVVPLTALGVRIGKKGIKETLLEANERSSKVEQSFYFLQPSVILMIGLAGLFSFSVLYFELYNIFAAVWARKVYNAYGSLLLTVVLIINITACVSIIFTYFQLNNRDYRWWWRSFFYGGATGFYVFLYAIHFYMHKSHLSGFLQTCFYFGYSALASLGVSLALGAVSLVAASAFIHQIYERHKVD